MNEKHETTYCNCQTQLLASLEKRSSVETRSSAKSEDRYDLRSLKNSRKRFWMFALFLGEMVNHSLKKALSAWILSTGGTPSGTSASSSPAPAWQPLFYGALAEQASSGRASHSL